MAEPKGNYAQVHTRLQQALGIAVTLFQSISVTSAPKRLKVRASSSPTTRAQNQDVFRDVIKLQGLDVRKRLRLSPSWNWLKRGARPLEFNRACPARARPFPL
jgi:hypothetical protein